MRAYLGRQRLALAIAIVAIGGLASFLGRYGHGPRAEAQTPVAKASAATTSAPVSEYSQRVVAYVNDTIPLTREEFGEYLIARQGAERLSNFVNRRIIELACKEKGIDVTAAEVEAEFADTLKKLKTTSKDFEAKILKPHNKTIYEWKEDAVKPRLMLSKLCSARVHVTEEDISKGYEAYYGEKIDCRLIMWPKNEKAIAMQMYPKIRNSETEFDRAAKSQASPTLAAMGGKIDPIGKYTAGNPQLEKAAFSLQPNELSQLIETPEGFVVLKCVSRIPPQIDKKLEAVREDLAKEAFDRKLQQEIPKCFQELHDKAHPQLFLKSITTEEELLRRAEREIAEDNQRGHR
jgi:hypothetical protein